MTHITWTERVISYIDGFNLYHGLRSKNFKRYYWINLVNLTKALLKENQAFIHCHYFTARIRQKTTTQSVERQSLWLDALGTIADLSCHYGHYLSKAQRCKSCGASWEIHEEKMTGVNIATQIIIDAYEDRFDTAFLISGDSDLVTPIKFIKNRFPDKKIVVAFPPNRTSVALKNTANQWLVIGQDKLRQNLLPNQITTKNGYVLERPPSWY